MYLTSKNNVKYILLYSRIQDRVFPIRVITYLFAGSSTGNPLTTSHTNTNAILILAMVRFFFQSFSKIQINNKRNNKRHKLH